MLPIEKEPKHCSFSRIFSGKCMKNWLFILLNEKHPNKKWFWEAKQILLELSSGRITADQRKVADNRRRCHSFTDKGSSQFAGEYYPYRKWNLYPTEWTEFQRFHSPFFSRSFNSCLQWMIITLTFLHC